MGEDEEKKRKKSKKKADDYTELEFELGELEFEAKGKSKVVERMFYTLLEKLETGKLKAITAAVKAASTARQVGLSFARTVRRCMERTPMVATLIMNWSKTTCAFRCQTT